MIDYIKIDKKYRLCNGTGKVKDFDEFEKLSLNSNSDVYILQNPNEEILAESIFEITDNICTIKNPAEVITARKLEKLREKRNLLLGAFDLWEKAVLRGREEDSEEIMQWYQDILDLNENSILDNIPEKITYYL